MNEKVEKFAKLWDNEIKPLVDKHLVLNEKIEFRDNYGCAVLVGMGQGVEHDLADGRSPLIKILQVKGCLNDEEYYQNVHNNFDDKIKPFHFLFFVNLFSTV
jgi:hypothetical protein